MRSVVNWPQFSALPREVREVTAMSIKDSGAPFISYRRIPPDIAFVDQLEQDLAARPGRGAAQAHRSRRAA
jgi:hypothetical protein